MPLPPNSLTDDDIERILNYKTRKSPFPSRRSHSSNDTDSLSYSDDEDDKPLDEKKKSAMAEMEADIVARAWPLEKYPPRRFLCGGDKIDEGGRKMKMTTKMMTLMLPVRYTGLDGYHKVRVSAGDDLNMVVYKYYNTISTDPDAASKSFVSDDGICVKRHELLGPAPCVAGYTIVNNIYNQGDEIHIKWWDSFQNILWINHERWKISVLWDGEKKKWELVDPEFYV